MMKISESDLAVAEGEYRAGAATTVDIAARLGVCPGTICKHLKRRGVAMRENGARQPRYWFREAFFDAIDSEEKAYWLGFIMADGCLTGKPGKEHILEIHLAEKDAAHLEKLRAALGLQPPVGRVKGKHPGAYLHVRNKRLGTALLGHGVCPRKSGRETLPASVPENLRQDFFRGYVDGDGSWYKNKGKYLAMNLLGGAPILEAFSKFVASIGVVSAVVPRRETGTFKITYNGNRQARAIGGALYGEASVYLDRKRSLALGLV